MTLSRTQVMLHAMEVYFLAHRHSHPVMRIFRGPECSTFVVLPGQPHWLLLGSDPDFATTRRLFFVGQGMAAAIAAAIEN